MLYFLSYQIKQNCEVRSQTEDKQMAFFYCGNRKHWKIRMAFRREGRASKSYFMAGEVWEEYRRENLLLLRMKILKRFQLLLFKWVETWNLIKPTNAMLTDAFIELTTIPYFIQFEILYMKTSARNNNEKKTESFRKYIYIEIPHSHCSRPTHQKNIVDARHDVHRFYRIDRWQTAKPETRHTTVYLSILSHHHHHCLPPARQPARINVCHQHQQFANAFLVFGDDQHQHQHPDTLFFLHSISPFLRFSVSSRLGSGPTSIYSTERLLIVARMGAA